MVHIRTVGKNGLNSKVDVTFVEIGGEGFPKTTLIGFTMSEALIPFGSLKPLGKDGSALLHPPRTISGKKEIRKEKEE